HPRQLAPVGAELEGHHNARNDAEPERDTEDLEPEFEQHSVRRAPRRDVHRLEHGEPCRQPHGERREDDVKRNGERELQPRQKERCELHDRPRRSTACRRAYSNPVEWPQRFRRRPLCCFCKRNRNASALSRSAKMRATGYATTAASRTSANGI